MTQSWSLAGALLAGPAIAACEPDKPSQQGGVDSGAPADGDGHGDIDEDDASGDTY